MDTQHNPTRAIQRSRHGTLRVPGLNGLSRVFSGFSIRRESESEEEIRGALGLNLLSPQTEPIAELVFIHGLGGGSRKTWSKSSAPEHYWPKEWLKRDTDFKRIRIHSFGYNAAWTDRRGSLLNINDFANTLLASLQESPLIRRSKKIPLVFVCHSMGGLVFKKAFLLAQHDPAYTAIGKRFNSVFFLATPHHGAGSAQLLRALLKATFGGEHPYLGDLAHESPAIHAINDEFRHHANKLRLYSFYETLPTSIGGLGDIVIVKKTSAIMQLPNERVNGLQANHRNVCKFESPSEPNYVSVRNAITETLDLLREQWNEENLATEKDKHKQVRAFLALPEQLRYADPSINFDEPRSPGSCQWISQTNAFRTWRDAGATKIFWLHGNPGCGKSYITHFVYDHLASLNLDCSFYFFRAGDKVQSALGSCLLSLASQMAHTESAVRDIFLEMQNDDVHFDKENPQMIWKNLFAGGILGTKPQRPHFWVLDALDECSSNAEELIKLFAKIPPTFPLQIFMSSRLSLDIQGSLRSLSLSNFEQEASVGATTPDIVQYIENHTDYLTFGNANTRKSLMNTILQKSNGCFLWVKLVLKELRKSYSPDITEQILQEVPRGMDDIYLRSLESLSNEVHVKPLAKAILMWAVCSLQPITVAALTAALGLYIDEIDNLENRIFWICGNLVTIGPHSQIKLMHQTARGFLLNPDNSSEFAINEEEGHRMLATICLKYLTGDELKAPRTRRPSHLPSMERSALLPYAATSFYEHIKRSGSFNAELFDLLYQFCSSKSGHILSWIEYLARAGDLSHITKAGFALQSYARDNPDENWTGKQSVCVRSWSVDLIRIVTKFGPNLVRCPPSIFWVIPPFCPPDSAPYKQFGHSNRGITVQGLSQRTWDDCLATLILRERNNRAMSVAAVGRHFAVGQSRGVVKLHNATTCQEYGTLDHGEPVRLLEFNVSGQMIAVAGNRKLSVWDVNDRRLLWIAKLERPCIALSFADNTTLVMAAMNNQFHQFDVAQGTRIVKEPWFMDENHSKEILMSPVTAAISIENKLLAFVYRGGHTNLWNWENAEFIGRCEKPGARSQRCAFHASSLVFNPAPNSESMAAAYEQGEIMVFDTYTLEVKVSYKADTDNQVLACSSDGRTLIAGDSIGKIRIFEFGDLDLEEGKLHLLYVIHSAEENIGSLAFCDSTRFVDTRGSKVNVWEPTVLLREDIPTSDVDSMRPEGWDESEEFDVDPITRMAVDPAGIYVLCGTESGSVILFEASTGHRKQKLYDHGNGDSIIQLEFGAPNIIGSADVSSKVTVHRIQREPSTWKVVETLLEIRMGDPVEKILFNADCSRILAATTVKDYVYSFKTKITAERGWNTRVPGVWCQHPAKHDQIILVVKTNMRIYSWENLQDLTPENGISLDWNLPPGFDITRLYSSWNGRALLCEYSEPMNARTRRSFLFLSVEDLDPSMVIIKPHAILQSVGDQIGQAVGTFGTFVGTTAQSFVFLDHDGWVSSIDMGTLSPTEYKRHFFLPYEWLSTNDSIMSGATKNNDFIFPRGEEVATIRRGFEIVQAVLNLS